MDWKDVRLVKMQLVTDEEGFSNYVMTDEKVTVKIDLDETMVDFPDGTRLYYNGSWESADGTMDTDLFSDPSEENVYVRLYKEVIDNGEAGNSTVDI